MKGASKAPKNFGAGVHGAQLKTCWFSAPERIEPRREMLVFGVVQGANFIIQEGYRKR
jgi:hypothetical protein